MFMKFNKDYLIKALSLLGHVLEREQTPHIHFVVCGGSSLIMMGLIARTTKDVDIVAFVSKQSENAGQLQYASSLPEILLKAASHVAADLGLDEDWLNTGPKDLLKYGLPEGFMDRLHTRCFGEMLTVSFIDRLDQIHFKVYAAVDGGPGRHVDDLLALKPDHGEMERAAFWAMQQDPSTEFKTTLVDMLKALNYETVTEKL